MNRHESGTHKNHAGDEGKFPLVPDLSVKSDRGTLANWDNSLRVATINRERPDVRASTSWSPTRTLKRVRGRRSGLED